jgi:hypothetical protein
MLLQARLVLGESAGGLCPAGISISAGKRLRGPVAPTCSGVEKPVQSKVGGYKTKSWKSSLGAPMHLTSPSYTSVYEIYVEDGRGVARIVKRNA